MPDASPAMGPRPLTFFFPYHEVSGVPVVFSRVADHLARRGRDVRVVDYEDGYMSRTLRGTSPVTLVPFAPGTPCPIAADSTLVMQSILPATMRPELHIAPETRLLFWTLHPMNLVQTIVPTGYFREVQARSVGFHRLFSRTLLRSFTRELRDFLRDLVRRRSIVFMDGTTLRATCERLDVTIDAPVFVPVPCCVGDNLVLGRGARPRTPLSVVWVGRLGDFKVHILRYTMARLSALAARASRPMILHIVGDGEFAHVIDSASVEHAGFRVVRVGSMESGALTAYLIEHADVVAAMGTSALDAGALGIPTILLDVAYARVPDGYKFRWLFETTEFSLGELLTRDRFEPGNTTLESMLMDLDRDYDALSRQTHEYCRQHHAVDAVAEGVARAAGDAQYRFGDLSPSLRRKSLLRRTFEHFRAA